MLFLIAGLLIVAALAADYGLYRAARRSPDWAGRLACGALGVIVTAALAVPGAYIALLAFYLAGCDGSQGDCL